MSKKVLLLIGLFVSVSGFCQVQWTLQDCLLKGKNNNLKLKIAALETQVVEQAKQSVASYYLPHIDANGRQSYNFGSAIDPVTNNRVSSNMQSTQVSLDAGITVFDYGTFINQKKQRLAVDYATLTEQEVWLEYQMSTLTLFYGILEQQDLLELQKQQLKNSKENLDRVQKEVDAGSKPKSDWYDIDYIYHNELISIKQTENSLYNEKLKLVQLLYIEDIAIEDIVLVQKEESIAQMTSYEFNPTIEKHRLKEQILEQDKRLIYAKNLPRLEANYQYGSFYSKPFDSDVEMRVNSFSKQLGENKSQYASLRLSIPLFQGGDVRRAMRVKKEEIKLNALKIKESERDLTNQITVLNKEIEQLELIAVQLQSNIELSEKTFATTQAKYENGKVDIFSFNAAKNQLLSSQFALKKNKHNHNYLSNKIKLHTTNTL
ncbi:MAG: TolC family protein [Flavobacteriaceae bacterium]|jgi:outer membrane protein|nr:TolC family protein [Flavobacteriaceae bacterium]